MHHAPSLEWVVKVSHIPSKLDAAGLALGKAMPVIQRLISEHDEAVATLSQANCQHQSTEHLQALEADIAKQYCCFNKTQRQLRQQVLIEQALEAKKGL